MAWTWNCNNCSHEGEDFVERLGSDLHPLDGLPIDDECPDTAWAECPMCKHLCAVI